jgi:hypothetical protein
VCVGLRAAEIERADKEGVFCKWVKGCKVLESVIFGKPTDCSDCLAKWVEMAHSVAMVGVAMRGMADVISEGSEMHKVEEEGKAHGGGKADTMDNGSL